MTRRTAIGERGNVGSRLSPRSLPERSLLVHTPRLVRQHPRTGEFSTRYQTILDLVTAFQDYGCAVWILGNRVMLPDYLASANMPLAGARAQLAGRSK
ncbi:MAG: hypothetical protein ACI82F_002731 [Planctomycetota bacterium]|jgi:hypothetical protein